MEESVIHTALLVVAIGVLLFVTVGCSDDGAQAPDVTPVVVTGDAGDDIVLFDLAAEGRHACEDEAGDVTTSVDAIAPPPVETPGIDLLDVSIQFDDQALAGTFRLAGPVDAATSPRYVVAIGSADDPDSFEVWIEQAGGGVWGARVQQAGDPSGARLLPTSSVDVDGETVTFSAPSDEIPEPLPNQPVFYGATAELVDESGTPIDRAGNPLAEDDPTVQAFDDCLLFGG